MPACHLACRGALTLAVLLVVGLAGPGAANAHGMRLPFAQWGGFSGPLLRCQRELARAAASCATTVWELRRQCRDSALAGGPPCDPTADPRRAAARSRALDAAEDACSERQFADVGFLGFFDVQTDLTTFCYGWPDTADALAYPPEDVQLNRECAVAAADAASDAARYAFRARPRCLDHAASLPPAESGREALLVGATHGASAAGARIAARLARRCPDFASRYGRTPTQFVELLLARADCIGGAFYIQDAVVCPAPVCGNRLVEPPETCDDGNTADGDACPSDCMR
jgi:cysteine-rich repeat protein